MKKKIIIKNANDVKKGTGSSIGGYSKILTELSTLLESARKTAARHVNSIMSVTYWEVERRIVEHEQHGQNRAGYGEELIACLATDLTARFGRGYGRRNLQDMRSFYLCYPQERIRQSVIAESGKTRIMGLLPAIPF
jgi:hypothetical protein